MICLYQKSLLVKSWFYLLDPIFIPFYYLLFLKYKHLAISLYWHLEINLYKIIITYSNFIFLSRRFFIFNNVFLIIILYLFSFNNIINIFFCHIRNKFVKKNKTTFIFINFIKLIFWIIDFYSLKLIFYLNFTFSYKNGTININSVISIRLSKFLSFFLKF